LPKKAILAAAVALALGILIFEAEAQSISGNALPTGGQIVGGQASISQNGAAMRIEQTSSRAAIDWQSFNIGAQASVTFAQPSASAIALNRVLGASGSEIFGRLSANGQVFLLNPNGILFGRGAQVDVGGLVASTLGISPQDFMSGRYVFRSQGAPGSIVNQASIRAPRGSVALIAPSIVNDGLIEAQHGAVSLTAANAATVDFMADGLVQIRIDEGALEAEIANNGVLRADGGSVTLTATARDSLASAVINNSGIIEARTVENVNGVVRLGGGDVYVWGTIDVSAPEGSGGSAHVLGERVELLGSARIDASGAQGGGEVLIGGDFQGKNPEIQNAKRTYVGPDAVIDASATQSGEGGRVIVWSDEKTGFYGTINARGGAMHGDGGFVEISSKDTLIYRGFVDVSAASGKAGSVLFDPKDITIDNDPDPDTLVDKDEFAESSGSSVTFDADQITAITSTGAAVTLQANNDITVSEDIITDNPLGAGGALTLEAGRSVRIRANITTDDAPLQIRANWPLLADIVDNQRDPGAAVIRMDPGTTINSGTALTSLIIENGAGRLSDKTSGNIIIANIIGGGAEIINNGPTPGSSILRASLSSMITAPEILLELDCGGCAGGGSIGTRVDPIRVTASRLESHIHEAASGIFIESPRLNQALMIGGVSFGGSVEGVQAITSGDITISVNGTLVTEAGTPAATCGAWTGGPICSGAGTVTLQADDMVLSNSVTAIDGTVALEPYSTNRDIRIDSPSPNVLSLTPSELKLISASTLKIGRATNVGKLSVVKALSSADLNAGLLVLQNQKVHIDASVDFAGENESLALAHANDGTGRIQIGANINVGSGQIDAGGQTVNISGSPVLTSTNSSIGFNAGTLNVGGTGNLSLNANSIVDVLNVSGGTLTVAPGTSGTVNGALTNTGTIRVRADDCCGNATLTVANGFTNDGWIELENSSNGFTATLNVTAGTLTNSVGHEIRSMGGSATAANTLNARLANLGTIDVQRPLTITKFPINDGTITLSNNSTLSTNNASFTNAATGIVQGIGTLELGGATLTNDGTIRAGASSGTLNIKGALVLGPTSVIDVEVQNQWTTAGTDFDVINATGGATLDGTLNIVHFDGAAPPAGQQMQVFNAVAVTKTFASVNPPSGSTYTVLYNPANVTIQHDSTLLPPSIVSEPLPIATTTVSATTGFEPSTVASAGMTSASATISTETSASSSPVALSVRPHFVLPDISHLIATMSEVRKKKLYAVENAVRILERDPAAADLPSCAGEVSGNCIAERPARLGLSDASDRAAPELAHLWGIERKIALLIGVEEYQDPIPRLGSPLKDIAEIGRLYREQFGYEVRALANADKASIVREINRLILETSANDSVVVFYAGHGHVVEKTGRGYWIPGRAGGEEPTQWISNSDIAKMLANIPARQVLLVSDSCYSGTLTREGKVEKSEVLPDPRAVLELRSVTVLSSGGDEPVADAGKDGHSVFAWHFLRTLGRVAQWSNGVDIYERLAEAVQLDFPQQPQYGAALGAGHEPGADFLFEVRRY